MLLQLSSSILGFLFGLWYAVLVKRSSQTFFKTLSDAKKSNQATKQYVRSSLLRVVIIIPFFGVLAWWSRVSMLFLLLGLAAAFVVGGIVALRRNNGNTCL
ncbi:hypothetical protein KAU11_01150 [Candidatus Babeliales bacterium]|nr:hypothetical protein [Candidatus Babeliales bacterium]